MPVNEKSNKEYKEVDYLEEDKPLSGQSFCCVSFLSPEGIMNCNIRGLKIRGVYDTYDEAVKRAEHLQKVDPDFHVFVGEVGKWLPWDPSPDSKSVKNQVYAEKALQELAQAKVEQDSKVEIMEAQRKKKLLTESKETLKKNKAQDKLREKLDNHKETEIERLSRGVTETTITSGKRKKNNTNTTNTTNDLQTDLETMKVIVDKEADKLNQSKKLMAEKQSKVNDIDENFAKIKALYEKLKS